MNQRSNISSISTGIEEKQQNSTTKDNTKQQSPNKNHQPTHQPDTPSEYPPREPIYARVQKTNENHIQPGQDKFNTTISVDENFSRH